MRKTQEQRTEQIDDTVRRTEVEVGENAGGERSAFGGFGTRDEQGSEAGGAEFQRESDPSR